MADELNRYRDAFALLDKISDPEDFRKARDLFRRQQELQGRSEELAAQQRLVASELVQVRSALATLLGDPSEADERDTLPVEENRVRLLDLISGVTPYREDPKNIRLGSHQRRALAFIPTTGHASLDEIATYLYGSTELIERDNARKIIEKLLAKKLVEHTPGETIYRRTDLGRSVMKRLDGAAEAAEVP